MDCTASPKKLICKAPAPNMTIFGGKPFREVIKVKGGHKGGTLINLRTNVPLRREIDTRDLSPST